MKEYIEQARFDISDDGRFSVNVTPALVNKRGETIISETGDPREDFLQTMDFVIDALEKEGDHLDSDTEAAIRVANDKAGRFGRFIGY